MADHLLPRLVQSLPQELYDEIYKLVFTASTSDHVVVTPNFPLPPQLRVSKASRDQFLDSYLHNTTFVFAESMHYRWISSLDRRTFDKIAHVKILSKCTSDGRIHKLQLASSERRLAAFYRIMASKQKEPWQYAWYGPDPADPEVPGQLRFFSEAENPCGRGDFHSRWLYEESAEGTAFTKFARA